MSVCDVNRRIFDSMLRVDGIFHGSVTYKQLHVFLFDPANSPYLQMYYLLLSGYLPASEVRLRTMDLLKELRFSVSGNYSYRHLFSLDATWYEYFKENAWPSGQRRLCGDYRRGVAGPQVDEIMSIKRGPPSMDLDGAISVQCSRRIGL